MCIHTAKEWDWDPHRDQIESRLQYHVEMFTLDPDIITSNYRQMCRPDKRMSFVVSSIVVVSLNSVLAYDLTAE